jgi:carboxymethylenebutenolidase
MNGVISACVSAGSNQSGASETWRAQVRLVSDRGDSPHRLADRFRGKLYCGFAEKDANAAPPVRHALSEAFAGCPVGYCFEVHPGVEHGYALPDRDLHDKRAANRDWELIFAMFRRQLSA